VPGSPLSMVVSTGRPPSEATATTNRKSAMGALCPPPDISPMLARYVGCLT
jgi:hypothetical protein